MKQYMVKLAFHSIPAENQTLSNMVMAFASNGIFIHCEIHFEDGSVGYTGKKTGIALKSVKDRDYQKDWIFYEIPCNSSQAEIMRNYFIENQNLKYNWTGILGNMITGLNMDFVGGQFCSQVCFNALTKAQIMETYGFVPSEVSPSDLQAIIEKLNWKLCTFY